MNFIHEEKLWLVLAYGAFKIHTVAIIFFLAQPMHVTVFSLSVLSLTTHIAPLLNFIFDCVFDCCFRSPSSFLFLFLFLFQFLVLCLVIVFYGHLHAHEIGSAQTIKPERIRFDINHTIHPMESKVRRWKGANEREREEEIAIELKQWHMRERENDMNSNSEQ